MDRKWKIFLAVGWIAIILFFLFFFREERTPYNYLRKKNKNMAYELLYQEELKENRWVLFFRGDNSNVGCAVIEKSLISFKILNIDRWLSPSERPENYLASEFESKGNREWIDWGIVIDKNVKDVFLDEVKMNVTPKIHRSYRIFWYISEGEYPEPSHIETYVNIQ